MSIIKSLNERMPSLINKQEKGYKVVYGDVNSVPNTVINQSSDINCGAISNELEFLKLFIIYTLSAYDLGKSENEWIDVVTDFFLNMKRIEEETDVNLINRFFSIIRRKLFPKWMVPLSIKKVFSYFFDEKDIFVINDYIETGDVILNGDFEDGTGNDFDNWDEYESGDSHIVETKTEHLEQSRAVEFQISEDIDSSYILQNVNSVGTGIYKFSMFYKDDGNCTGDNILTLTIRRSGDSKQYDAKTNTWISGAKILIPKKGLNYVYYEVYVVCPDSRDLTFIIASESTFLSSENNYKVRVDKVRFGIWPENPSVKVFIASNYLPGSYSNLWPAGSDPIATYDYENASFLDNDFLSGPGSSYPLDFLNELLDKVKTAGIKSVVEVVSRYGG
jgi:hypothetical protein